ncbi:ATP-binding protein [Dactylosporangium sp. AC04546]|uniref:NACHT domain-containing protein n=1 Tax=Dactylosporangium sp. AC04546 TaxID=2862460 RepID=UPI001EDC970A|nr:ATP-binding protein [Dactylosporangium sp. AC04546]WVK78336.1 ATP-binding protein [Dactylosporangium sp. AC04546]
MRLNPELTYRGALRILGHHDHPTLTALDTVLGGAILAAGIPGAAAFGWVDQDSEALGLIRKLLDATPERLRGTSGRLRQELVVAAHTTIVGAALFEALRTELGGAYRRLGLTDARRHRVGTPGDGALESLYEAPAPIPTAVAGFQETAKGPLKEFFATRAEHVMRFLDGLAAREGRGERPDHDPDHDRLAERVAARAGAVYLDHYLRLAGAVPEFLVWTLLVGQAASYEAVRDAQADLRDAAAAASQVLRRLELLLTASRTVAAPAAHDPRSLLHDANRSVLDQPILPRDAMRHVDSVAFPLIGDAYVTPSFRAARSGSGAGLGQEQWWDQQSQRPDLDAFIAAHLGTPESVTRPLLVLGHPGAGKSLLTKVIAARLPAQTHTVIRVPLRNVDADAPVYEQIQQALRDATHGRVDWAQLTAAARDTTRVVLLDGLDELLQASSANNSGYIQRIVEFQRQEARMELPVVVIVTSRTLVVDRASIPPGTPVLRLDDFTNEQVSAWLTAWGGANAAAARAGAVRLLSADAALRFVPIARQPLLLLMLALYAADPGVPDLDAAALSTADLYGRLLDNFVRREVVKTDPGGDPDEFDRAVELRLWHLAVAAFAMFNRGQQSVSEDALNADLLAMPDPPSTDGMRPARRTVGQFFFVHTAQSDGHRDAQAERSYEFLHATFGEYLIADHTVRLLADLAARMPAAGRHIDDDLVQALLSHQTLATRERILPFAQDIAARLDEPGRAAVLRLLSRLLAQARRRVGNQHFATYITTVPDPVAALAAYTANLVLLRTALAPSASAALEDLLPSGADRADWEDLVWLWRSALRADCRAALLENLSFDPEHNVARHSVSSGINISELTGFAYLTGDPAALYVRAGYAVIHQGGTFAPPADDAILSYAAFLSTTNDRKAGDEELDDLVRDGVSLSEPAALMMLPNLWKIELDRDGHTLMVLTDATLRAFAHPVDHAVSVHLALLVARRPEIIDLVPGLTDARWYQPAATSTATILRLAAAQMLNEAGRVLDKLCARISPSTAAQPPNELALAIWDLVRSGDLFDPRRGLK